MLAEIIGFMNDYLPSSRRINLKGLMVYIYNYYIYHMNYYNLITVIHSLATLPETVHQCSIHSSACSIDELGVACMGMRLIIIKLL